MADQTVPPAKFADPDWTADGQPRAVVAVDHLRTLWVNTGTLCNLTCAGCYIESSPRNDRLGWFLPEDLAAYCTQIRHHRLPVEEIGFTGGEPFMNPHIDQLLEQALASGARVLVLSHSSAAKHEALRGVGTFAPVLEAARWLSDLPLALTLAGRQCWNEDQDDARAAYAALCAEQGLAVDCADPQQLVLFPEMTEAQAEATRVPEITTACWDILGLSPTQVMCASARMVVRRQGAVDPTVLACTLIAYDPRFDLGPDLAASLRPVPLAHPHCAAFCVLGGARCSG
jgi:hypothetical protein